MNHTELNIWKSSIELVKTVYTLSSKFPKEEQFGLTNQIRRAAVSITSNIAEGFGRESNPDIIRFLIIARGSINEVEAQYIIAKELCFCMNNPQLNNLISETRKMISGIINRTRAKTR